MLGHFRNYSFSLEIPPGNYEEDEDDDEDDEDYVVDGELLGREKS